MSVQHVTSLCRRNGGRREVALSEDMLVKGPQDTDKQGLVAIADLSHCFKFHPTTLTIVVSWIHSLLAWKLETSMEGTCYAIAVGSNGQAMVATQRL